MPAKHRLRQTCRQSRQFWQRWLRPCLLAAVLLAGTAQAAPKKASPVTNKQGELRAVQSKLKKLNQNLAETEKNRAEAIERLKKTESAISTTSRQLHELGEQRSNAETELNTLQQQAQRLESQLVRQQGQLGRLLYRQYLDGNIDALHLLLSGGNANQAARDLYYTSQLSRAKAELLKNLKQSLQEKQRLGASMRNKREELVHIERQQQRQHDQLLLQQQQRQTTLDELAGKLKSQRRQIDTLKRDEKRLAQVIDDLVRKAASQAQARASRQPRPQAATKSPNRAASTAAMTPPGQGQRNEQLPEDLGYVGNFAALKGKLRLPVRGELANRFGAPRAETGATWRGLFIRASEGSEVKALAPGRIVFADWLRGFGNLLIIDHGNAWLSVYGNNQSLFRQVGDTVKAGDTIAAVGNSGGNPESGLYFELRQRGQAINPLTWVSLK
ncbi:MAG: peptidoglycan DD-metalloendopeptidase family protein [Sterolibacterium sp.]|nr:peptidoglycan DD-metalloendopeptidase family protein [Sterolibacterium sp.]